MASKENFDNCDFTDATLLAQVGESPFKYTIPSDDAMGDILYFACQIGDHCAGGMQKLQVGVTAFWGNAERQSIPSSSFVLGTSVEECNAIQEGTVSESDQIESSALQSFCSDPVLVEGESHMYYRSCLSGPATLTPGGVVNRLFVMQDPFPQDYRVVIGQRTFEFVEGDPDSELGITPVPVNQLYVHHLSGSVVFGQGTEGVRNTAPDAPFPKPYGLFSGEDGNTMIFHLIDLRQVDDWLACIECRCDQLSAGTYLDELTQTGNITGGVNCCSNCTDITTQTVDYRMRYNITYLELQLEDEPVTDVRMLTADISPAAGGVLEHDVFSSEYLPGDQVSPENPHVQRLEMVKPFNEMFKEEFFGRPYGLSPTVQLLRCVAHLHVAAIEMWVEDATTGERICDGKTTYGTDPDTDKDFLTAVSVSDYDPPFEFPEDLMVRFVSEYNATNVHTGVMGYFFLFVAGDDYVSAKETNVTVDLCFSTCDASLLPTLDITPFMEQQENDATEGRQLEIECVDTLAESPSCTFGGLCECETFVNAPESTGCGGVYASAMGDVEVNSVCNKYCGCTSGSALDMVESDNTAESPTETQSSTGGLGDCKDTLESNPACRFGGVCSCEEFANAEESEGCGGLYKTEMGDTVVNEVCALYCDACVVKSAEELFDQAYSEVMTLTMQDHCRYATKECQATLSNLYSCAKEEAGIENVNPMVQQFVIKHGEELALENAKLGTPSLHVGKEDQTVEACSIELQVKPDDSTEDVPSMTREDDVSSSETSKRGSVIALGLSVASFFFA